MQWNEMLSQLLELQFGSGPVRFYPCLRVSPHTPAETLIKASFRSFLSICPCNALTQLKPAYAGALVNSQQAP